MQCCWMSETRSAVYTMNKIGPSTEPCGTPHISWTMVDRAVPRRTYSVRLVRYDWNHLRAAPPMPKLVRSLCSVMSWSTVSNAADRPNRTSAAKSPRSTAARMSYNMRSRAVSVEWSGRKPDCSVGSRPAVHNHDYSAVAPPSGQQKRPKSEDIYVASLRLKLCKFCQNRVTK